LDDILITGRTVQEHLATLEEVLQRMETAGLRLKKSKCKFLVPSVTYLGHQIDAQGLHPVSDKVKAIQEAPEPRNVSATQVIPGLIVLLFKILAKYVLNPGTFVQIAEEEGTLVLVIH